jgi:GT2 family glycosyltransferase
MIVSIVIPTHNRSDALAETLLNLAGQEFGEPWEVVIVNNRSTDDTDDVVRCQPFPVPLRLIHEDTPGAAAARNTGIRQSAGRYVILLDNDILVEPDFIRRHHDLLLANPGCWILGQIVNLPEQNNTPFGRFRSSLYGYIPRDSPGGEAYWLAGTNVSMPRADWERLGGFDERFSGASVEDYDFAVRAWDLGIKILFCPSIVAVHNDWAGFSIQDYCRRQRLYSQVEPLFWRKYGERHPRLELVKQNLPPDWKTDGPVLFTKKLIKTTLAAQAWQRLLFGVCRILERKWPWPPLLHRLYTLALAVAIYQGFREGLRTHGVGYEN